MWTGKSDSKTLRVDAIFFKNEKVVEISKQKRIRVDGVLVKRNGVTAHFCSSKTEISAESSLNQLQSHTQ